MVYGGSMDESDADIIPFPGYHPKDAELTEAVGRMMHQQAVLDSLVDILDANTSLDLDDPSVMQTVETLVDLGVVDLKNWI